MREWYVLTYIFGSIFIAGQVLEYARLIRDGVTISSDAYGSVFYLTTGFHGLHVTGGLIAILLIIGRTFTTRRYTRAGYRRHRDVVLLALRRRRVDCPVFHDLPTKVMHLFSRRPHRRQEHPVNALGSRRRHPAAIVILLLLGLVATGGSTPSWPPGPRRPPWPRQMT